VNAVLYSRRALKELRRQYVATEKKQRALYKQPGLLFSKDMEIVFDIQREK